MKKNIYVSFTLILIFIMIALSSCNKGVPTASLKNDIDSISYAQGVIYASQSKQMFKQLNFEKSDKDSFLKGFQEGFKIQLKNKKENALMIGRILGYKMSTIIIPCFNKELFGGVPNKSIHRNNFISGYVNTIKNHKPPIFTKEFAQAYAINKMRIIRQSLIDKTYSSSKEEELTFLKKNKLNKKIVTLPSGLQYKVIVEGKGKKPKSSDIVKIHYKGTNIKGKIFYSSYEQNTPVTLPLNKIITGLSEGIQLMPIGSRYIFYIPSKLAYGAKTKGQVIPPFATLIFEVQLFDIIKNFQVTPH